MTKNKANTKQKLINTISEILINEGFQKLGINNVAEKAGVSKVLIYRYFGDFNGLIEAYARQKEYWIKENNQLEKYFNSENQSDFKQSIPKLFTDMFMNLIENPDILEIKRWELYEKNHIIETIGKEIENIGVENISKISKILNIKEETLQEMSAIVLAGLYYLALRSKTTEYFNGINIQSEKGRERIIKAIETIFTKLIN